MPARASLLIAASLSALLIGRAHATRDIETSALPEPKVELVVVEAPGCKYCRLFRRDIVPLYAISPRAREAPLRFVELATARAGKLTLASPVDVVPTILILRNGRETGRIPGYLAPESFFRLVNHLLARAR
jgi:thioredoxin-related protein